ncbi:MAG TPA: hypothetical protein VFO70_11810, partial [Chitinophagaceae bacterium]|nr:hypothetical protein [Chitinophagaceae bacterium]
VNEQERVVEVSATREDSHLQQIFRHNIDEATVMSKMYEDWKAGKKSKVLDISGEELKLYNQYRNQLIGSNMFPTTLQAGDRRVIYAAFFSKGMLALATVEPRPEESIQLLERFATVFDLTYTRFLDLQKAEAQGREARIEASLERVRSKAMAMHSSRDLADTIGAFYHELETFHITPRRCGVGLLEKDSKSAELSTMNTTDQGQSLEIVGKIKMEGHPVLEGVYENWLVQKEFHPVLRGNEIKEYYQMLKPQIQFPDYPNDSVQYGYFFYFPEGGVYAWTDKEMAEDELKIYRRFTAVLSLTYKRYKELKEAEAQTRESQIELGLERVRARAMAMQKSDELKELIGTVFTELTKLDLVLTRCLIMIYDPKTNGSTWWIANSEARAEPMSFFVKYHENPPYLAYLAAWQERKLKWQYVLEGKDKLDWDDFIFAETELSYLPDFVIAGMRAPERVYLSASFNNFGNLTLASLEPLSPEHSDILLRFAKVFDLTYTRFNDLKQAEAQARQAKIEAAMEKVRSRALAMQKPDELVEVAEVLRKEMGLLGVEELETSSIYIHNEASGKTECWFAMKDAGQDKKLLSDHMTIDLNETGVGRQMLAFYHSGQKQVSLVMRGAERKEWIQYCAEHAKVFGSSGFYGRDIPDRTYHLYKFSSGYLGAASPGDISAESWDLLQRATSVFSLAYTRFSDLQQAEASAKEAVKQAALDRVRAEIASMRTTSDLEKITPLIWKELTILGIPFIRCGVFIMDDSQQLIHTFLSTPEGKAIAAFHLPYNTPGNLSQVVRNWQNKKIYTDHWDEEEFIQFADILVKQGTLGSREQYLKTIPHGGFYLHFLPFLQGMLYVGNTTQLGDEDIKLLQSVADAFSTAYARYEDFNKLEAAKQQVDETLTDLKQTQQQLIQAEKMASLGELTAGIAHEIQNPLNFVNNFAQVSNELLAEMVEEVSKGNYEEAKHLAGDVIVNLEKIDYHGKRADAIVKGMLQHSRASSGQKELTDINELAEEYLRLAYHGWRAKDRSFNTKFETDFDANI